MQIDSDLLEHPIVVKAGQAILDLVTRRMGPEECTEEFEENLRGFIIRSLCSCRLPVSGVQAKARAACGTRGMRGSGKRTRDNLRLIFAQSFPKEYCRHQEQIIDDGLLAVQRISESFLKKLVLTVRGESAE